MRVPKSVLLAVVFALALPAALPAQASETVTTTERLRWSRGILDAGHGAFVEGGSLTAEATADGVRYTVVTNGLEKGHSYTMWVEFVNHPEFCLTPPGDGFRCGAADFFANPLADGSVVYGSGVASATGNGDRFEAFIPAASLPTDVHGLASYGVNRLLNETSVVKGPFRETVPFGLGLLSNPLGAEYQTVIVDHGPYDPERFGDDQWTTHMGGAHIEEGIPWALASGEWGPEQGAGFAALLPWPFDNGLLS